ncbi:MAG: hypothetical protein ACO3K7_03380 [Candidatus Marinamargulisbacteria bacterium]
MKLNNKRKINELLEKENYTELIEELQGCDDLNDQLILGIAHYKLNQWPKAQVIFEALNKIAPTIEIQTYLIITYLKQGLADQALNQYVDVCQKENQQLMNDIHNNNIEMAKNRCLLLLAIPINAPDIKDAPFVDLKHSIDTMNYTQVLHQLNKEK